MSIRRAFWFLFGVGTHALFALTVWRLFPFLLDSAQQAQNSTSAGGGRLGWLPIDLLLAAQFGLPHSLLLAAWVRKRLGHAIPSAQYGCFFCTCTCIGLLLTMELWQPSTTLLWRMQGAAAGAMTAVYVGSWVALLYSLQLTGLGYQTGFTTWRAWMRGRKASPRRFEPRGAYLIMRHPVYMSLLGMLWLTPVLSLDRLLLNTVWTAYIFVGSALKDRRMASAIGEAYLEYQARVPGYPFLMAGPLSKVARIDTGSNRGKLGLFGRPNVLDQHSLAQADSES